MINCPFRKFYSSKAVLIFFSDSRYQNVSIVAYFCRVRYTGVHHYLSNMFLIPSIMYA